MEGRVIKLIAKHGDDLRQDMLTIQMLTIMDKVSFNWVILCLQLYDISFSVVAGEWVRFAAHSLWHHSNGL